MGIPGGQRERAKKADDEMTLLATLKNGTVLAYSVKRTGEVLVSDARFGHGYVENEGYQGKKPEWRHYGAVTGHVCRSCQRRTYPTRHEAVVAMLEAVAANLRGEPVEHGPAKLKHAQDAVTALLTRNG